MSASPSRPIRIALVGLGWVGTQRHLPALRRNPHFEVVGVVDRDAAKAQAWAARLGNVRHAGATAFADVDWLADVDAVDVATAPMAHFGWIRDALSAGKHVLTEKPFTMSVIEGETLVALAAQAGRSLAIVHNFQFASSAKRLLADMGDGRTGALGTIRAVSAVQWGNPRRRLPTWYEELPGGLFYDESPHLLYLLRRLSPGPLRLVSVDSCASTLGHRTPASIDAQYRAEGPAGTIPVSLSLRFEAPVSEWHVSVLGDKGAGLIDIFRDIYIRLPNDGGHGTKEVLRTSLAASWMHWKQHVINGPLHLAGRLLYGNDDVVRLFAGSVRSGQPASPISGVDALEVLKMQHDILGSIASPAQQIPAQPEQAAMAYRRQA